MLLLLLWLAAAGNVEMLAEQGLTLVDRLPVAKRCLAGETGALKTGAHMRGGEGPLVLATGNWASSDLNGMIAGLILREHMGYEVDYIFECQGSNALHRSVTGCDRPAETADADCVVDRERALVHAAERPAPC